MKLSFEITDNNTVVMQIVDGLRREIISGNLKPGEKIKELSIANTLGVSRSPIREAFQLLQLEGIVELIPRKGAFVRKARMNDIVEVYEVREMIEVFAGRLSAERMTDHDLMELEKFFKKLQKLKNKKDLDEYLKKSSDFHSKIVALSRNTRLNKVYSFARNYIDSLNNYFLHLTQDRIKSIDHEHYEIINALKKRDKNLVEEKTRRHVQNGMKNLIKIMEESKI